MLNMPALSPTMESGVLKTFAIACGTPLAPGDLIAEVETDKSVMDWESTERGVVARILKEAGATVKIGEPVVILGGNESDWKGLKVFFLEHLSKLRFYV